MKKLIFFITLFYFVGAFELTVYAQVTQEQVTQQIESFLKENTGANYSVSAHSFNKISKESRRDLFQDPYGTLKDTYLFEAALLNTPKMQPHGIIGIYKKGKVLWHSKPLYTAGTEIGLGSIYRTMDINNDNKVELIVSWTVPVDGRFGPKYGWIFSWDGSKGKNITETDEDGVSVIETHEAGAFYFVDVNGDGILEIYTDRAISQEKPIKYKRIFYSWNGQKYGVWPDTPHPHPNTFYPRDRLNVTVHASIRSADKLLRFQYIVANKKVSQQGLNEFYLVSRTKSTQKHTTKTGWRFSDKNRTNFFYWSDWGMESNVIPPGKSDSSFTYSTSALPFIARYYIQGANETPTDVSFEEIVEDIKTNSVTGYTLGPYDPPKPFDAGVFTDSLYSFTRQACDLGWVTNKGICRSLQAKLDNVQRQLKAGKTKTAANGIQSFLNEVEAQKGKHLTSEGYGLLYFNAEYLLKGLQKGTNRGQ